MISRRDFLKLSVAGGTATFLASRARFMQRAVAAQSLQMPLPGSAIPQFVDPVPHLLDAEHLIVDSGAPIELEMREHTVNILPAGAVAGYAGTYVWSYLKPGQESRRSYLGPVVIARRGQPTKMKFVNLLGHTDDTNVLAYKYSTDQTLHWADPLNDEANMFNHMAMPPAFGSAGAENYQGPIPACVHLHGGEVPPQLDGGPDAWFTSDGSHVGHGFYSEDGNGLKNYSIYRYPNSQEGALIWFHDHTLGATRLNVFCGLAGGYLITDPANDPPNLPELFPLVIQDRTFDTNGQLFLPADSAGGILWAPNPEHPYWVPEFVGDTILVNGKTWPFMNVEPKRYTFMFVNGSNARTYEMALTDPISKNPGPALWVIGTDGGYLDTPVRIDPAVKGNNRLVMMPGERYWVIVDFKGYEAGVVGPNRVAYSGTWMLKNTAKAPFPGGATPNQGTTDRIMQFRVVGGLVTDVSYNPATRAPLRSTPMVRLTGAAVQAKRQLTLNEVMGMPQNAIDPVTGVMTAYPGGPLEILVNNTKWNGEQINGVKDGMYTFGTRPDFTVDGTGRNYISELPQEGTTEVWEIINLTADAHPMHLHLVQFQLLNRQNFDLAKYNAAYNAAFPGGGYDSMTGQPYPAGVYIPAFGPPLNYNTGNTKALGGNPDINATAKGKPLYLQGLPKPALPQEAGWKDTVITYPGQVTRILVRWAPTDIPAVTPPAQANFPFDPNGGHGYVWHCHIVDHEDNEMMRPTEVVPNAGVTRTYIQGVDY
ncbi:MAG TPA: multicopper oxidase domain-containing protein [Geobacteraceae bacterium]